MKIEIRNDKVEIEGYVNAVERRSKPISSRMGKFVERICKGAFKRALDRNDNVRLLLNHDHARDLGGTKDGNLELTEDAIGLHARATVADPDVVQKARKGDLVGWSFGFTDRDVDMHDENGIATRDVKDLDLYEVSLLDRSRNPAYDGTLVAVRAESEDVEYHGEPLLEEVEVREIEPEKTEEAPEKPEERAEEEKPSTEDVPKQPKVVDYTAAEKLIQEMKGEKR